MADLTWLRLRSGPRYRTSTGQLSSPRSEPSLRQRQDTIEGSREHQALPVHQMKAITRLPSWHGLGRPSSSMATAAMEPESHLVIRDLDDIWHNPSVDQIADALRVAIMSKPTLETLPINYHAHILHVIEAYDRTRVDLTKTKEHLRTREADLKNCKEAWREDEEDWMVREARYKTEIKRLELIIHHTSDNGLEAVTLARTESVIRGKMQRTITSRSSFRGHQDANSRKYSTLGLNALRGFRLTRSV